MSHRQHSRLLVVRLREPSPVGPDHLQGLAEEVLSASADFDTVAAFGDLKDLLASVEAGVVDLD